MHVPPPPPVSDRPPVVWSLACSDPSGGAGIQADLKTFHGLGVYGATALLGLTVQNTLRFDRVEPVADALVRDQVAALRVDLPPAAVKLGMLASPDQVGLVAGLLRDLQHVPVVCDPILKATLGAEDTRVADPARFLEQLGPVCTVLTPNRDEAERLSGIAVTDADAARSAANRILAYGFDAVVIKSAEVTPEVARDGLFTHETTDWFETPARPNLHTHGAGCAYASAIAAGLAHGFSVHHAVALAKVYVDEALRNIAIVGSGRGPLAHGGWPERRSS